MSNKTNKINTETIIKELNKLAINKGANSTKVISTKDIVVSYWVRQKCEFGCDVYAMRFTCPPYTPTIEQTKKVLQGYKKAMLVELTELSKEADVKKLHHIMYELEKFAFLNGLYKAFAYVGGPCKLCKICPAESKDSLKFNRRDCKNLGMARPSMESCGIDVYQTVRNAGYEIHVIKKENDCFKIFGLLLLE